MNKLKKQLAVLVVLTMVVASFAGCSKKAEEGDTTVAPTTAPVTEEATPEATPTPEPPRNLNGIAITVGDWFSTGEVTEPATQKEEDQLAYRAELQTNHNFTLEQVNLAGWAEYAEIFITSTMSGDPAADIFIMDQAMVPEPIKQGLCYPVSDLPSFDFSDEKWNSSIKDAYTQNGKTFAFSEEKDTPGLGVFWNKRLFEEAGLDPELLYDLQKNGEWTWDKFHELAKQLTIDSNSDGVTDTYGISTWQREVVKAAVFSNGADYVRLNEETGRYENNQMSDEVLQAMQLGVDLYGEGLIVPQPEGAQYTFFVDAFKTAQAAMCSTEWYRHTEFQDMEDDWGFVFFPVGPAPGAKMQTMYVGNVRVIPSGLDALLADDIAFAYNAWVTAVPGYEDDTMDLTYYYSVVRDTRAVDETVIPMLTGQGTRSLVYMIPGLSFKHGANEDNGGLGEISAVEIAEAASANYDGIIADFYAE
ncbi:MAG: ABC transporter substrate-binding protein [Mobilitalea sp.]